MGNPKPMKSSDVIKGSEPVRMKGKNGNGATMALGLRTRVMGALNVTPDSFSERNLYQDLPAALERAAQMVDGGADIIDIGGESTRPGADPIDETEEINRVIPVVEGIKKALTVRISVDTRKASVAQRAIDEFGKIHVVCNNAGGTSRGDAGAAGGRAVW